jgi:hypothetical protein
MKSIKANLQNNLVTSYDQTKTTLVGRVFQKTIDGTDVVGPPLNQFVDAVQDSVLVNPLTTHLTANGRLFSIGAETGGFCYISCHDFDEDTGATTFIGNIRVQLAEVAATTTAIRGFKVLDNAGATGWKIYIATTANVLYNSGVFCVNKVDKADLLNVGFTAFDSAVGSDQKATYLLQDPANIGINQLNIASAGLTLDSTTNRIYVLNGVSAAYQAYVYSTTATLNCPTKAGTINEITDRITITAHGFNDNGTIQVNNLVGGAGLTNGTRYFVRNSTANDFQLSATFGGAAINITTAGTVDICRAFGTTGDAFVHKTGNLPALSGTLLLTNSQYKATPQHTPNAGEDCLFFATTNSLYIGKLSELTSGAVTWPSLYSSNLLGSTNQILTPSATSAVWSDVLDQAIFCTNYNILIMKPIDNNVITRIFGGVSNNYRETKMSNTIDLGAAVSAINLDIENGWLVLTHSTTGQRGNVLCDILSDAEFDYSYIVTPVLKTPSAVYKFITTIDKLYAYTGSLLIQYRTTNFGSISGSWVDIPFAEDITSFASGEQVQFKIAFDTLDLDRCLHAQLQEFFLGYETLSEISENWEYSDDWSDNGVPSRIAFRLKNTYATSVPTLYFRAYDLTDALLITNNSIANAANFEYSTDNGLTWLPLGIIPNIEGTLIRYTFTSPPGVDIRPAIREE